MDGANLEKQSHNQAFPALGGLKSKGVSGPLARKPNDIAGTHDRVGAFALGDSVAASPNIEGNRPRSAFASVAADTVCAIVWPWESLSVNRRATPPPQRSSIICNCPEPRQSAGRALAYEMRQSVYGPLRIAGSLLQTFRGAALLLLTPRPARDCPAYGIDALFVDVKTRFFARPLRRCMTFVLRACRFRAGWWLGIQGG